MNILIIGNGFDLAHELPTKYTDFLKFTNVFKCYKDACKKESIKTELDTIEEENKDILISLANLYQQKGRIFEEIDSLISSNLWNDHFWKLYTDRKLPKNEGWIDFESEISKVIQILDESRHTILEQINQVEETNRITQKQFNILIPLMQYDYSSIDSIGFSEESIEHMKKQLLNDLNKLTRCLEIYLEEFVEQIEPKFKLSDIEKLNINCVLSFNYTHTYSRLYDTIENSKIKYDYIHGEVKTDNNLENCNLILGIDEYLEGYDKNQDNEFIQFKKFFQRIYKKTGCAHVEWKETILSLPNGYGSNDHSIHNLFIFGHSLSVTDKDILKTLINMKATKTTIFYHDQESLARHIANLVKILGEEELIAKVHGKNATIIFQKQQISSSIEVKDLI